jgi:nucleoside-diphosphate-sugar epimerase
VLRPAIRGTLEILEAAHRAGSVKRVVVTSSFAAMENYGAGLAYKHVYTEEDWCQLTYDHAKAERTDQL